MLAYRFPGMLQSLPLAPWTPSILILCALGLSCGDAANPTDAAMSVDSGDGADAPIALDAPTEDAPAANVDGMSIPDASFDALAPPPDNCSEVVEVVLDGAGTGSAAGSFAQLAHDYSPPVACPEQSPAPDAVYAVQLPAGIHDVSIDTFGSSANTILAIGFECSASGLANTACNDDADDVGPSRMWLHRVQGPSELYILVDSLSAGESGSFQLNIHRQPAAPDRCPGAIPGLPLDITGGGTVVGLQQSVTGATRGTCMSASDVSGEAVFLWTAATSGTATFVATSFDFAPDVYVRENSCAAGTEASCAVGVGTSNTLSVSTAASTTYYTFLDGGSGSYALEYRP